MGMDDPEAVVDYLKQFQSLPQEVHGHPGNRAGKNSNNYRSPGGDYTRSRGDRNKTGNHALYRANDGRFLVRNHITQRPDEQAHCRRNVGVQHSGAGVGARGVRITTVESIPTSPKNT